MINEARFRDKPASEANYSLAIPSVLTILVMIAYNVADLFFIDMLGDGTRAAAMSFSSRLKIYENTQ